ncbi:MAG: DUF6894 family protein [Pseudorhizobium sp.]
MQRYFFTLNFHGEDVIDPDGANLPDLLAAECDAREAIREIAIQDIKMGKPLTLQSISVCDEEGRVLAKVTTREALEEILAPVLVTPAGPAASL